ncbi:ActS/PrrB/RegB family redox-sensitive histidine kinase [Rhodovibrio salinarum]|uniref:histidine kinase n=1 Tax=Rhodovibrio salinarum TaxID=1087 RepID=A0A934UZV8_9PROT|nr:ActS/PrrB/RegB family redox-sensitive histidine kinase [Rhodovibrio salinarum]MBK1697153.1 sensor histidine kinase [Rhodovibrio salinarum]
MTTDVQPTLKRGVRPLTPTTSAVADGGRVRLRTLNTIRWVAVGGQMAALALVYVGLEYPLPIVPAVLLVLVSVATNLQAAWSHRGAPWLTDRGAAIYLAVDLVQLSALLALTGGLANPFALLILAPVTVSASVLSRTSTLALAGVAILSASVLALWHVPLPWANGGLDLPRLYIGGIWAALVLAVSFIAAYVFSLAAEAQRMSDALSATQMALAREQRLSALGGLAAAAAHELGSPLGTIAVVAREIRGEVPEGSDMEEDAELLLQETQRCRDILARLAAQPEGDQDDTTFWDLPLSALAQTAGQPFQREEIALEVRTDPRDGSAQPTVQRKPEILHAIGTLVQNAMGFANSQVVLETRWDARTAELAILDDGPGFDPQIVPYLGEPYLSTRRRDSGGENMGLGIFIARTLLARTGADVLFDNRPEGGAQVIVRWPRARLEEAAPAGGGSTWPGHAPRRQDERVAS